MRQLLLTMALMITGLTSRAQYEPNPILPDTLFLALGNGIEIFNDDVAFVRLGDNTYTFEWTYSVGNADAVKWYWTADQTGSFPLTFSCYEEGALVDQASTVVHVTGKESGQILHLLTIGNSLTASGFTYQFATITGDLDLVLNTMGTQGTTVRHEGYAGWTFERFLSSESPFYYSGIDFGSYISAHGFPVPDVIRIFLGINECFLTKTMPYIQQTADDLIAEIRNDFPESLVLIAMPTLCENSGTGWIAKYGDLSNYERYQLRMREFWEYLLNTYSGPAGSEWVQVTYDGLCIDRDEGYPKNTEGDHTNGVHPNVLGYGQLTRGFSNVLNRFSGMVPDRPDTEPPSTPQGLQHTGTTETSISFSWNSATDNVAVIGYRIFVDGAFRGVSSITSYTVTGLDPGTQYSLTVTAVDEASNESGQSAPLLVTTTEVPDNEAPTVPAGLGTSSITHNSIGLVWENSQDNVGVEGYRIFLGGTETGVSYIASYTLTGLDPETAYTLSVSAFDAASNESARSAGLQVTTLQSPDTEPPSIPTGLEATGTSENSIALSWNPSTDNVAVTGYNVYMNGSLYATVVGSSYIATGLPPGTSYTFVVTAFDASANESGASEPLTASTGAADTTPPSTPQGLVALLITEESVQLTWERSTDSTAVAGYHVYLDGSLAGTATDSTHTITGLAPGETYEITVSAFDPNENESEQSESIFITTSISDIEPPSIPGGLVTTAVGQTSIGLAWSPSTDNVGVAGYNVYSNEMHKGSTPYRFYTLTGLSPGLDYTISVTSYDFAFNESANSDPITVRTFNPDQSNLPVMPDLSIIDLKHVNNRAKTTTRISSLGHTDLQDFGLLVRKNPGFSEEGMAYYADGEETLLRSEGRSAENLQFLYRFASASGNLVEEVSGSGSPVNLTINPLFNTLWMPWLGLKVLGDTRLTSDWIPAERTDPLRAGNEITVETWIRPVTTYQQGDATILSIVGEQEQSLMELGQMVSSDTSAYTVRLRTSDTDEAGNPQISTSMQFAGPLLHHLVYTRNSTGEEKIYVNGMPLYAGQRSGTFAPWTGSLRLSLANSISGGSPWNGTLYLAALYNRELDFDEVLNNFQAGIGQIDFTSDLQELEAGQTYYLYPFARTDQGIAYGDSVELLVQEGDFPSAQDSILLKIFPNPSSGKFSIYFEDSSYSSDYALLKISDLSGNVLYMKRILLADSFFSREEELDLTGIITSGFYSLMLVIGTKAAAKKLVIVQD